MLTIGQMSKICGVSVKTLRHYEKIGLLRPGKQMRPMDTGIMRTVRSVPCF